MTAWPAVRHAMARNPPPVGQPRGPPPPPRPLPDLPDDAYTKIALLLDSVERFVLSRLTNALLHLPAVLSNLASPIHKGTCHGGSNNSKSVTLNCRAVAMRLCIVETTYISHSRIRFLASLEGEDQKSQRFPGL